ncbi:MAG: hypothetical protein Q9191_006619 [Dirinaria sp. TL-2023a]
MRQVVEQYPLTDAASIIKRVQDVGRKLVLAQPKELAVGNIVRRVLGVIRDEAEENRDADANETITDGRPPTLARNRGPPFESHNVSSALAASSPLMLEGLRSADVSMEGVGFVESSGESNSLARPALTSQASSAANTERPLLKSMFSLLSHPRSNASSPTATPGSQSPSGTSISASQSFEDATRDLRAEAGEAIEEIMEELDTVDDQIAGYGLDHIYANEVILTHTSSVTVQKFLLKAAGKRKFTVIFVESFPNAHESVHATVAGSPKGDAGGSGPDRIHKSLTAAGITVVLVPDSAIFALMPRVNKVILSTHAVLANGSLVTASGARLIAKAANAHKVPVMVLAGVYKLSPIYPFNIDAFIEYGDTSKIVPYEDGELLEKVDVENPLHDYVPPDLVDLYITNLYVHSDLPIPKCNPLIPYLGVAMLPPICTG